MVTYSMNLPQHMSSSKVNTCVKWQSNSSRNSTFIANYEHFEQNEFLFILEGISH